jgi:hypothetical protein
VLRRCELHCRRRAGRIHPDKFVDALAELVAPAEKITTEDPADEPAASKSV